MQGIPKLYQAFFLSAIIILTVSGCKDCPPVEEETESNLNHLFSNKDLQLLGEKLFFDESLSEPEGQSCASCHGEEVGWTGPDENINKGGAVYPGALHQRFGNRKPNSSAYASLSPLFHALTDDDEIYFAGGNFWDGRATGYYLGNPAADQAQGPFLNPLEQNNANAGMLIEKIIKTEYVSLFNRVGEEMWGIKDIWKSNDLNLQFGIIGIAIAAFENSDKVNQFSSKYDYYLKGEVNLSDKEKRGLKLFNGKAKCALCHISTISPDGSSPLFTDFTFDNLGLPANLQNPWYSMDSTLNPDGANWIDPGLEDFIKTIPQYAMFADENFGKHQVPTLRNTDKRPSETFIKAFGHNGYFKSLEDIVHFYNTRDILPYPETLSDPQTGINSWPKPEVSKNINKTETGNLGLSAEEESAIIAFLKTLSDGYIIED